MEGNSAICKARTGTGDFLNDSIKRKRVVQHSQLSLGLRTNRRTAQRSGEAQRVIGETMVTLERLPHGTDALQFCSLI